MSTATQPAPSNGLPETNAPYAALTTMCRDLSSLSDVLGLLSWDEQVMMPDGATEARGKQKATLTSILHEKATSTQLRTCIAAAKEQSDALNAYEKAIVRDAERNYQRAVGVPTQLERKIAEHEVASMSTWAKARNDDDFASFSPMLSKMLTLTVEKATCMNANAPSYDVLIDTFERGMTAARLSEIFAQVDEPLREIMQRALDAKQACGRKVHPALHGGSDWDIGRQNTLCKEICKALGFDFTRGRIDVSVHPFTGGAGSRDVRITTRYSDTLPFEGIMGTVHETGHAMYEQGRNQTYAGLPVSEPLSMGVHESQSLFWERMIAQRKSFWQAMLPKIHEHLPHTKDATADDFYFAVNQVNASLIRVDADEVTYPFHIMLRFDLERKLIGGELDIEDLPKAWADGMRKYIGIEVPSDREGCLQDVHWSGGAFGYFPSYTLGAMMAAQLFRHLKAVVLPDVDERIARGEFLEIRQWLRTEIHERGSLYPSLDELLNVVTGEPLNPKYFLEYLDEKYIEVYAM